MLSTLRQLADNQHIRPLDYHFARLLSEQCDDPVLLLAAALTSYHLGQGHTCLELAGASPTAVLDLPAHSPVTITLPCPPQQWAQHLKGLGPIGDGSRPTPLVLDNGRLYLMRYWLYETAIAARLNSCRPVSVNTASTQASLRRLFNKGDNDSSQDWQMIAAAVAATRDISVISGGPGTGKTTTVTRLLALLVELALEQNSERLPTIHLTAPTGKAAARLTDSITQARNKLKLPDKLSHSVRQAIPDHASTLHRLLRVIPGRAEFRHNRHNPLHLDILVVDEASMIDVSLMARLLEALPPHARLILLGDRDQLASVEAGSVLGDICAMIDQGYSSQQATRLQALTGFPLDKYRKQSGPAIRDSLCLLRKSYRFDQHSGIGELSRAVNAGDKQRVQHICQQDFSDIELVHSGDLGARLITAAVKGYRPYLEAVHSNREPAEILELFDQFQLLCALREGPWGVTGLNQMIEKALARTGLIAPETLWYPGRPVLITRNDPALNLYNGDIGITLLNADGALRVAFPETGAQRKPVTVEDLARPEGDAVRMLPPSRLPEHATVFAMTVHKSQGSEFEQVLLALPDSPSPVLTRELVYTGITRARSHLELLARPDILASAVDRPITRITGLAERLL